MSAHTPGPWRVNGQRIEYGPMVAGDGFAVAKIIRDPAEHKANARLIAAAPALLEALEGMLIPWATPRQEGEAMSKARAAIAQAKGESK